MAPEADDVVYMLLRYETYPYDSGIADTILRGQNSRYCLADYEQYWQRRSRFVSALAGELRSYGGTVLTIVEGRPASGTGSRTYDEALGSLLDVVPAQVFAATVAERLAIDTSFKHIGKVIERL